MKQITQINLEGESPTLKSGIKNGSQVTLNLSSNLSSNDENNFLHKLLLTNAQVSKFRQAFPNNSSANIKLSKTKLSEIVQLEECISFISKFLPGPFRQLDSLVDSEENLFRKKIKK